MKALKASKKLIMAIVSFVLSLVLCIGVCLAWFSANNKVKGSGSEIDLTKGDILEFTVQAFYLDAATGGYTRASTGDVVSGLDHQPIAVDDKSDGKLTSDKDNMRPYGGLGNTFATAVVFEISYKLAVSDKNYRIYASCPTDSKLEVSPEGNDNFKSALSNAVGYYSASKTGSTYAKTAETAQTFVQNVTGKKNFVILQSGIVPTESASVGTLYVIMDYVPANFMYLSSQIVANGGNLSSKLDFFGDLSLNIESYDQNDPEDPFGPDVTDPDPVEPDDPDVAVTGVSLNKNTLALTEGGSEKLTATVAPANATNKNVSWSSSDAGVAAVGADGTVTAVKAGTATITVTTADGNKTAQCSVTVTAKTVDPDPTPDTPTNLFNNLPLSVKSGEILNTDDLTLKISGSADITTLANQAVCSDGTTFDKYLFPSGSRTYTITVKEDVTLKVYYTVRDSSSIKSDNVTATVDGTVYKTSSDGTRKDDIAYVMEIKLIKGQECVLASAKNRLILYGIYVA